MNFDDSAVDSLIERVWIENIDGYHQKALEEWGHPLAKLNILEAPYEPSNILKNSITSFPFLIFALDSGLKILWVACDMCHQRFKDYGNLFRHKARVHQCDQPCPYCRKPTDNYDEFLDHLKASHNVPYRCSSCSAIFDERRLLEAHYDLTHGDLTSAVGHPRHLMCLDGCDLMVSSVHDDHSYVCVVSGIHHQSLCRNLCHTIPSY
ncbi:hypothetical protein ACTXT7_009353 [Hymenolepis weldensis]